MVDYTFEQYMSAARKADAAGDGNAARRLVQAAKNLQQVVHLLLAFFPLMLKQE